MLAHERALVKVVGALADRGLEPLLTKGLGFARWLYDTPTTEYAGTSIYRSRPSSSNTLARQALTSSRWSSGFRRSSITRGRIRGNSACRCVSRYVVDDQSVCRDEHAIADLRRSKDRCLGHHRDLLAEGWKPPRRVFRVGSANARSEQGPSEQAQVGAGDDGRADHEPVRVLDRDGFVATRENQRIPYVDIHAHVLPGIDDGPDDLDQSLAMLRAAVASGTSTIAATPHLRPDFPDVHVREIGDRCQTIREEIGREHIPLRLVPAAEVSVLWGAEATDEDLWLASYDQRGTDLLVETPNTRLAGFDRFLGQLREKGYRITLGHPERNAQLRNDDGLLREVLAQGILLQLNADSILGSAGGAIRRFARHLLTEGLAHSIASDGHRGDAWRPVTRLAEAAQAATELVGPERAGWMTEAVPEAILTGAELPAAPAVVQIRRRRLFGRR